MGIFSQCAGQLGVETIVLVISVSVVESLVIIQIIVADILLIEKQAQ